MSKKIHESLEFPTNEFCKNTLPDNIEKNDSFNENGTMVEHKDVSSS